MPSAEYFRRQADICVRLSLIASEDEVSNRLLAMAREYKAKSEALARQTSAGLFDSAAGEGDVEDLALGGADER